MFQNFANFLLSSVRNQESSTSASADGVENTNLRLTSAEAEDEWVLVDRDSEGNSDFGSVESLNRAVAEFECEDGDDDDNNECEMIVNLSAPSLLTRASSTSSLPCLVSNMDESWFVTPPPCFISTGPIHMETSPLENLLIEHPSMSVYTHHGRRHFADLTRVASPPRVRMFEIVVPEDCANDAGEEVDDALLIRMAPRNDRIHLVQQQEIQVIKCRQSQKVQIRQACKSLQRGHMDRNNKAREVNSRNRRQRRGERSQGAQRSHANNNRKC